MKVARTNLARKISEKYGITLAEAQRDVTMIVEAMKDLIDEGCTEFQFTGLFTVAFKKYAAKRFYNVTKRALDIGRPQIRPKVIISSKMRERVRKAFDIQKDIWSD